MLRESVFKEWAGDFDQLQDAFGRGGAAGAAAMNEGYTVAEAKTLTLANAKQRRSRKRRNTEVATEDEVQLSTVIARVGKIAKGLERLAAVHINPTQR